MFVLGSLGTCLAASAASCACSCCTFAMKEAMKSSARMAWSILFTLSLLLSWILRDFAKPLLERIPWIISHGDVIAQHSEAWFGMQAVYRVSMGSFLLFSTLSLVMLGVRYQDDWRDTQLHHGSWALKGALWLGFSILPFFFPNGLVNAFSWFARVVSPLFLAIQLVIILDVTQSWNDEWVEEGALDERFLYALLGLTILGYSACIVMAGFFYHWFAPSGSDCSLNISLITIALLLCLAVTIISLHPTVSRGSIFPAAAVSVYIMYLQFSALQSEPREYDCNTLGQKLNAASGTTLAGGMLLALLSVVWAAFRAGSNTDTFSLNNAQRALEPLLAGDDDLTSAGIDGHAPGPVTMERGSIGGAQPLPGTTTQHQEEAQSSSVSYSYSQFYLVFALASAYIAMLMTGWGSGQEAKDLIDVGWVSVWVKVVSGWGIAALYGWMLLAPVLFPDRDFA